MTTPTPADLIRAAEIEEALAEWFKDYCANNTFGTASAHEAGLVCANRAAALRAMASQTQEIE